MVGESISLKMNQPRVLGGGSLPHLQVKIIISKKEQIVSNFKIFAIFYEKTS
jgi:hypothetical protein